MSWRGRSRRGSLLWTGGGRGRAAAGRAQARPLTPDGELIARTVRRIEEWWGQALSPGKLLILPRTLPEGGGRGKIGLDFEDASTDRVEPLATAKANASPCPLGNRARGVSALPPPGRDGQPRVNPLRAHPDERDPLGHLPALTGALQLRRHVRPPLPPTDRPGGELGRSLAPVSERRLRQLVEASRPGVVNLRAGYLRGRGEAS